MKINNLNEIRELTMTELTSVDAGMKPEHGAALQLGLMGAAFFIGSGGIGALAFGAAWICYSMA
jgi:hypothetical protein